MVRQLVNWILGPWGRDILAFYVAHSAWINGVVVLYGVVLMVANLNLRRIERAAKADPRASGSGGSDEAYWEDTISRVSFFPLVAGSRSLIPRRTNIRNILSLVAPAPEEAPSPPDADPSGRAAERREDAS
jgi:hypothetical protein